MINPSYKTRFIEPIVLLSGYRQGIQYKILDLGSHPTAYIGFPKESKFVNKDYDELYSINVHGGLTYSKWGDGRVLPSSYYWFGWDYAHLGDYYAIEDSSYSDDGKKWTTEEIFNHVLSVIRQFITLEKNE